MVGEKRVSGQYEHRRDLIVARTRFSPSKFIVLLNEQL